VLSGLLLFHQSRAELATSIELTQQRLVLARELRDSSLEMLVHENFGTLAFWRGEFRDALVSLREALSRYTPEGGRSLRLLYGTDTAVVCTTYEAQALLFLGFPDQALRKAEESVAAARRLGHVHSLVLALSFAGSLRLQRGEPHEAVPLIEEASTLASEQQLSQWIASATVVRGDILVTLGHAEEGIAEFFAGVAAFQASGATIAGRYFVARLAAAHLAAGRAEEGLALLERLLPLLVQCEDVFYDAEVARIRGRLLLAMSPGDPAPAETRFLEALELARRHGSKFLELRAATSLAGLWRTLGKCDEARRLLVGVHGGFSEGFTTSDFRDATTLLAELTGQPEASAGFVARTNT
jgi:predicted ATPase